MPSFREGLSALGSRQKTHQGVSLYSRYVNRPWGRLLAAWAHSLGISANTVTALSAVVTMAGLSLLVLVPPVWWVGIGCWVLLSLGFALDSADGQVARIAGTSGPAGEWLDHVVDAGKMVLVHTAVLVGWYRHHDLAEEWLVVPLTFQFVAVVMFAGLTLVAVLKRAYVTPQRARASTPRALLMIPLDYGVLCLAFVLWGAQDAFLTVYTGLMVLNAAALVAFLFKWLAELRAVQITTS